MSAHTFSARSRHARSFECKTCPYWRTNLSRRRITSMRYHMRFLLGAELPLPESAPCRHLRLAPRGNVR
jgi:hypothetical protein